MKRNMQGFTLVEVLVAAAIAMALSTVIAFVLAQLNRLQPLVERYTAPYFSALIVQQQLVRDLSGAEVPVSQWLALAQQKGEPEKEEEAPEAKEKNETDKDKKEEKPTQKKEEDKKKIPLLKKIFIGTVSKEGMLDTLTFITTNPLQPYWGPKTGKYVPRVVRVTYRLREDKMNKNKKIKQYALLRQESENMDPEKMEEPDPKKWNRYMLVDTIKSLKIEYVAAVRHNPEQPKEVPGKEEKQSKPAKETYEIQTLKEWKERKAATEKDKEQKKQSDPLLPQLLKVELVIHDPAGKKPISFSLVIPVYTEHIYEPLKTANTTARLTDIIKKLSENVFVPPTPTKVAQQPAPQGQGITL